jgi:hypothetical protein
VARLAITAPLCAVVMLTAGAAACVSGGVLTPVLPLLPPPHPHISALAKTKAVNISDLIRSELSHLTTNRQADPRRPTSNHSRLTGSIIFALAGCDLWHNMRGKMVFALEHAVLDQSLVFTL